MKKTKYILNPDKEFCHDMFKAIKDNSGYCPCALEKTKDTKCPCKNFREEIIEGYCGCGLYKK